VTTLKILYVDDEPDIREVASMSLEIDPQIEVRTAASGEEALAQLDAGGWAPDLFLLDVMMPGMDGPGLLKRIRERPAFDAAPAVFITARAQPSERDAFLAAGAVGVIAKPFDPLTLASEVRAVIAAR
jgi:two-component system OmpR family response regulator